MGSDQRVLVLVAAFDHVRRNSTMAQLERFKKYNLFGIEQESYVAVLSIVNMIFRGDGKHNITEGNCFYTYLAMRSVNGYASARFVKNALPGSEPVTRVLMNPPFALKGRGDKEYRFVSRALDLMADGGVLFSLLPLDAMFRSSDEKVWRRDDLLKHHTLLSVMSFPPELFMPAALKQVVGVIIKKGTPHQKEQPVFWARIENDGLMVLKSKRLPGEEQRPPRKVPNDMPEILPKLRHFIADQYSVQANKPRLCKTAPIDFDDPLFELVPEIYLDTNQPSPSELFDAVDNMVRETAAFLLRFQRESKAGVFNETA